MQLKKPHFFSVTIPGKVGIKKNSRRQVKTAFGQTKNIPSERYRNWEAVAVPYVYQAVLKQERRLEGPLHAYFEFHFKNNKAIPDTSNCIEGPQDVMETCRVYANDKQIVSLEAKRLVSGVEKTIIRLYEVVV